MGALSTPAPKVVAGQKAVAAAKTSKMSVNFSSDTKMHDGLCESSSVLEKIVVDYMNGHLKAVEDLKGFINKKKCCKHVPSVCKSIKKLISLLKRAGPGDKVPLLIRGGGKGFTLTCEHLEKITQLHNALLFI